MFSRSLHGAFVALALLLSTSLVAQPATQSPWSAPAFSVEPKTLVAAAQRVDADDHALILLSDEADYVVDADGNISIREHTMYYVVEEAGVESVSEVRAAWQPWHEDRPTIDARVVTAGGTAHPLDAASVVEVPAGDQGDIFSDSRVLRAPLPAVAVGSIVEYVIHRHARSVIPGAGTTTAFWFGGYGPVEHTRVTIDAPLALAPRIVDRSKITPRVEERDGRRRTIYEKERIEGTREFDSYVPYDTAVRPYVALSTGQSWQHIATSYAAIVDKQIADAELQSIVRNAIGKSTDRKEIVAKLLAAIQKDVRYAGIEIGEGSIVPRTPKQVLANRYGDCKDKASLLVAMLRIAGIPAHVALLNAGTGLDTPADLPALGHFNHAITVADGEPAIWVDPTDVFARPGELPLMDQGRMALIAKPGTTALVKTPETVSTAHMYREQRTLHLPEDGKARVVEITEPTASSEASLRRWLSGMDAKTLREQLESYAKSAYVAKSMTRFELPELNDLSKPFRMTIEAADSNSGIVGGGDASVAVRFSGLPQNVPAILSNWKEPQPDDDPEDAPKKREHDFLFPEPSVREWVYRIIPPVAYVARTLPPSETKQIGTMTYSQELRAEPDQSITAKFRFDTGKRRLTAAEFEETRVAYSKFVESEQLVIGFDQTGRTKLEAGDIRGALDEYRRLSALHPKEAQHHTETAYALLVAGLGDAAREEIRRAIAIEPTNARAHQMMGAILLHDSLGREYRKGFDRDGAIAAFRKAKELKPDDLQIRVALIRTLTYGTDGYRFTRDARLGEAADEIKATVTDLGDEGKRILPDLGVIYAHMGRFEDVRTLAATIEDTQQRDLAKLVATTAIEGVDAAVRELSAFDAQHRRSYAAGVAKLMMDLRRYPEAATLMDLSSQGTAAAADQRQLIDILKKLKRVEDVPADEGPRGVVRTFFQSLVRQDLDALLSLVPKEYIDGSEDNPVEEFAKLDLRPPDEFSKAMFGDLITSMFEVQQDGDDETGYRLRLRMLGADNNDLSFLVRRRDGKWRIFGAAKGGDAMTGLSVLDMAAKGELEAARKWLNWVRDSAKGGTIDDPLQGEPVTVLWPKAKATATLDEIRIAASSMVDDKSWSKKSEAFLTAGREKAASDAARAAIDLALARIYDERKEWPHMLEATTRLVAAYPDSSTAFSKHIDALLRNGKSADAATLAKQRLERLPGDRDALHALALGAAETHDYAAAQQYAGQVVDQVEPKRADFALAAWMALFTDSGFDRAIEQAQHASKEDDKDDDQAADDDDVSALHTLAALYAATGRNVEARTALLKEMDNEHRGTLADGDWFILGRIAENYGVHDFAVAAYRKIENDPTGRATIHELAQRRLEGLTKKK